MGKIISLNISKTSGTGKQPVDNVIAKRNHGIVGDAHARDWHRQISLLAIESINKMRAQGFDLEPGSFAENITTEGLDLLSLPIGTRLVTGSVELEITQIGKKCHAKCNIFEQVGDCVMPKEGIFVKVVKEGIIGQNEEISVKQQ